MVLNKPLHEGDIVWSLTGSPAILSDALKIHQKFIGFSFHLDKVSLTFNTSTTQISPRTFASLYMKETGFGCLGLTLRPNTG